MFKKIISMLLCALMVFPPLVVSAENALTVTVDAVNTSRSENKTVLYDSSYGETTNTNEWGVEVTVTCGIVTAVDGYNNTIPDGEDCYVISGHGTAGDALRGVTVGMTATFDQKSKTVTFRVESSTHKAHIDIARNNAISQKNIALKDGLIVSDIADARFEKTEALYVDLPDGIDESYALSLITEYNQISALYRERAVAEYRAIWISPMQKTYPEVEYFVRRCAESGINMISVETFWDGTMICPMPDDSHLEHNPDLNGFDLLGAYVELCHKYNIELHCWMPVFRAGDTGSKNWSHSVAAKKPEWQLLTNNGLPLFSDETTGEVFLNPASSEVRDFLLDAYAYILSNYDVDGLQLDFIRYKAPSDSEDFGYDASTVSAFKTAYPEYSGYNIIFDKTAAYWQSWVDFRANAVSDFVKSVHDTVESISPDVMLSADVGAVTEDSYNIHCQDSKRWAEQGWIDMVHPMAYSENDPVNVKTFLEYMNDACLMVPILGTYKDEYDASDMLSQTCNMLDIGCHGIGYFAEEAFFAKDCGTLLKNTLFTSDSVAPSLNNANTVVISLERFITRVKNTDLESDLKNNLIDTADTAIDLSKTASANASADTLLLLKEAIENSLSDSGFKNRLLKDVAYAYGAALRDNGDRYEKTETVVSILPKDADGALQLTIDKINAVHKGEDSVIITDPSRISEYNVNYTYVMLLAPVEGKNNTYKLIESRQNYGTAGSFNTALTADMIVASFHTDDVSEGLERRDLAKTVEIGTELVLWGIDAVNAEYSALNSMLYIPIITDTALGDVDGSGEVDQYDYLLVKRYYFGTYMLSPEAEIARADVNRDDTVDQLDYLLIKRAYFGTYAIE